MLHANLNTETSLQDPDLLTALLARQRKAFRQQPKSDAKYRIARLQALENALLRHQDILAKAISDDFGHRSADEFKLAELLYTIQGIKYCIKHIPTWMKPEKRHVPMLQAPGKAHVHYQPLGVVGIVVPWNYPIYLSVGPLMYAIAAGNRAMIKMSSYTPRLALAFKAMLAEVFFEDEVAVVTGQGAVSEAFSELPFDMMIFTGSTRVGRTVMQAASRNLTPVILELGGKSPVVVHSTFPLEHLVERLAFGKCWNAGQTCIAPDHMYLSRGRLDEFVQRFSAQVAQMYPTMLNNPDYTAIINPKQLARIRGYLDDAVAKGATLIEINPAREDFSSSGKMPVTLVTGVTADMDIMHNEIFGPVLPIIEFGQVEEALTQINEGPRPLALYYLDYDMTRAQHVIDTTHSGGVTINDVMQHAGVDDLPFGGVGHSGMGRYHGREGFISLSNSKSVLVKSRMSGLKFILPPFNKKSHELIKKYLLSAK